MILHTVFPFVVAFVTSAVTVRIVLHISRRMSLFDAMGSLKIHTRPTPRLGGIGVMTGLLLGVALCGTFHGRSGLLLLLAFLLVWATGLWDDFQSLPPLVRLVIHALAGVLIYAAGIRPFGMASGLAALLVTVLTTIVFINAFNFLDGADGIASGTAAIGAFGLGWLLRYTDPTFGGFAFALASACLGFLLSNFPPALIFMGDSGSTLLGAGLAVLSMRAGMHTRATGVLAFVFVAVPLVDFVTVIARRLAAGHSPLLGDRSHFYDRLLDCGWSTRRVALTTYAATFGCGVIALYFCGVLPKLFNESFH